MLGKYFIYKTLNLLQYGDHVQNTFSLPHTHTHKAKYTVTHTSWHCTRDLFLNTAGKKVTSSPSHQPGRDWPPSGQVLAA